MKPWQYLIGGLAVIGIAIQLIPNELPVVETNNPDDLIGSGVVEGEVAGILKSACYDCHSNETKYPWYSYVAPVSWLVAKDIREGREELNFSTWQQYDMMEKLEKLDDIAIEVGEGEMPMKIYTYIHSEAKLTDAQRQLIITWTEATMDVVAEEEETEESVE
ncbi:heme-binding domain-containing protein [Algoriphagus sp. AK58]|uniref:heme-binding domain-containing protein n=1 Tax=Algoriphagus sp. AK58 TaxID=1406877 RepID=UPI00164F3345|nr:heme-binding domain-containing protein [Algoriphagus sp. AK58]MBC6368861.1 cytochrome C [Algoriphagus sp. AK58]